MQHLPTKSHTTNISLERLSQMLHASPKMEESATRKKWRQIHISAVSLPHKLLCGDSNSLTNNLYHSWERNWPLNCVSAVLDPTNGTKRFQTGCWSISITPRQCFYGPCISISTHIKVKEINLTFVFLPVWPALINVKQRLNTTCCSVIKDQLCMLKQHCLIEHTLQEWCGTKGPM